MKQIKFFFKIGLLAIASVGLFTFSSCQKQQKGCAEGYYGDNCDLVIRDLFIGTYTAEDINKNDSNDVRNYTVEISKGDAGILSLNIKGALGYEDIVFEGQAAWMNPIYGSGGSPKMTMKNKEISEGVLWLASGSYLMDQDEIEINYVIVHNLEDEDEDTEVESINYEGVWKKQ